MLNISKYNYHKVRAYLKAQDIEIPYAVNKLGLNVLLADNNITELPDELLRVDRSDAIRVACKNWKMANKERVRENNRENYLRRKARIIAAQTE